MYKSKMSSKTPTFRINLFPKNQNHVKLLNSIKQPNTPLFSGEFKNFKFEDNKQNNINSHSTNNSLLSVRFPNQKLFQKPVLPYITQISFPFRLKKLKHSTKNNNNDIKNSPTPNILSNSTEIKRKSLGNCSESADNIFHNENKKNNLLLTKNNFLSGNISYNKGFYSTIYAKRSDSMFPLKEVKLNKIKGIMLRNTDKPNSNVYSRSKSINHIKNKTIDLIPSYLIKTNSLIKSNFALTVPGKTKGGFYKRNQDDYLVLTSLPYLLNVFGVFDGHGDYGHLISNFLSSFFNEFFNNNNTVPQIIKDINNNNNNNYISSIISQCDKKLKNTSYINTSYSGSTCNLVFILNDYIICSNIGDSRAIMITNNNQIIQMSRDHKPELPDESKRIYSLGGTVERFPSTSSFGPYRVWVKNENYPGLAMSRSIGDTIAENIGVISLPEINVYKRSDVKAKAIVIASDGVWEFISNEKIRNIILEYYDKGDIEGCVESIKDSAVKMWNANGDIMDDISIIVVFL